MEVKSDLADYIFLKTMSFLVTKFQITTSAIAMIFEIS